jgi:hypothetical protein
MKDIEIATATAIISRRVMRSLRACLYDIVAPGNVSDLIVYRPSVVVGWISADASPDMQSTKRTRSIGDISAGKENMMSDEMSDWC